MLHPRFFATPDNIEIQPWQQFAIVGYSQVEEWTLIRWRLDYGFDGPNGSYLESESLYRGQELVACDRIGGELPLYTLPQNAERTNTPILPSSPWEKVDRRIGVFGVPPRVAVALREPENIHYFQAPG